MELYENGGSLKTVNHTRATDQTERWITQEQCVNTQHTHAKNLTAALYTARVLCHLWCLTTGCQHIPPPKPLFLKRSFCRITTPYYKCFMSILVLL